MHLPSLLAQTGQADRSAGDFLGDDHPLVRVLMRASATRRHLLIVTTILAFAAVAWLDGARAALAVIAAAAVVEVILALRIASLSWLARERACDLIIHGRADLPVDAVRDQRSRLLERGHCHDLARWIDRTLLVAERSLASRHQPLPLGSARVVVAARAELEEIAERLRSDSPGVRGVALVERLLSEGGSPLHGGSVGALQQELRRIRFMLGA